MHAVADALVLLTTLWILLVFTRLEKFRSYHIAGIILALTTLYGRIAWAVNDGSGFLPLWTNVVIYLFIAAAHLTGALSRKPQVRA